MRLKTCLSTHDKDKPRYMQQNHKAGFSNFNIGMKKPKTGGRKKNVPNRITGDVRRLLSDAIEKHLISDLNALEPIKRAELLIKVLPYVLPPITTAETNPYIEPLVITRTVYRNDGTP